MKKVIGIDLGGTRVKAGLFYDGYLKKSVKNPSNADVSREAIIEAIRKCIDELWEDGVEQIGIVSAGDIDYVHGVCTLSFNLKGWTGCPIKAIFEEHYHVPVFVENDAIGALLGELTLLPHEANATMLTFGTGVGGASVIEGRLSRSEKTTWGHVVLIPNGNLCVCGKKGCVESYLSAPALLKMAQETIPSLTSTAELDQLYRAGKSEAVAIAKHYGQYLNLLLEKIGNETHPDILILGGGLMAAKMMRDIITIPKDHYVFAQLGNLAGVVGAASLPSPLQ